MFEYISGYRNEIEYEIYNFIERILMHLRETECDDVNNTRIISQLHPALKHKLPRVQLFFKDDSNNQSL